MDCPQPRVGNVKGGTAPGASARFRPCKLADVLEGFSQRNALEADHVPWISSSFDYRKSDSLSRTLVSAISALS
jgi:hypothetical protein